MSVLKTQTTVRIELVTYAKFKKIAIEYNRSVANFLNYLIMKEISAYEKENGEIILTEEEIYF